MSFYGGMKGIATGLLKQFNQGVIEYEVRTKIPSANSYDKPKYDAVRFRFDAVSRGVSDELVDGVNILSTDLQVIASTTIPIEARIIVDGVPYSIVRHDKIPPSGLTVANRYIVRA